jgi:hypothetical protein
MELIAMDVIRFSLTNSIFKASLPLTFYWIMRVGVWEIIVVFRLQIRHVQPVTVRRFYFFILQQLLGLGASGSVGGCSWMMNRGPINSCLLLFRKIVIVFLVPDSFRLFLQTWHSFYQTCPVLYACARGARVSHRHARPESWRHPISPVSVGAIFREQVFRD